MFDHIDDKIRLLLQRIVVKNTWRVCVSSKAQ